MIIYFSAELKIFENQYQNIASIGFNFITTIIVIFIIDSIVILIIIGVGRRILLILGSILLTTSIVAAMIIFNLKMQDDNPMIKLIMSFIYLAIFGVSYGPAMYFDIIIF